jgi:hypothetical protein
MDLLHQFLDQEATPHVRELLLQALSTMDEAKGVREFTFNRFNVLVDTQKGTVALQDDLDTSEIGELELSLTEFAAALAGGDA